MLEQWKQIAALRLCGYIGNDFESMAMIRLFFITLIIWIMLALTATAQMRVCSMYTSFETTSEARKWRAINDGVMGGLSSGGPRFENGHMVFEGVINTNGGGFSSLRSPVQDGALADASGVKLRVRSDGRAYKLTLRSDAVWRGRRVSFQAPIPRTEAGRWAEVTVPFSELRGTMFGRSVPGAKFDRNEVVEMGILIADGRDGPFRLDVEWIADCAG